ncbi:MAG: HEAT repeat domain-containing protein, partial [Planctomycetota bacterium]
MKQVMNGVVFAAVVFAAFPQEALTRDPTVGACTQKGPFAKKQARLDLMVRKLSAAPNEKKKASIAKSIASKYGTSAIENLIRYREPSMKHVFLKLVSHKKWPIRARALYGLKMVGDASVVEAVAGALADKDARVREMAANALCHIGGDKAKEFLEARKADEKDPYVLESIEAAVAVLSRGEKPYATYKGGKVWTEKLTGPEGAKRVEWEWVRKGEKLFNDYDA